MAHSQETSVQRSHSVMGIAIETKDERPAQSMHFSPGSNRHWISLAFPLGLFGH